MDNTIQLYVDKKKEIKGYPITSPDRVIDENGVNIKEQLDGIESDLDLNKAIFMPVDRSVENGVAGGECSCIISRTGKVIYFD